MAEIIPQYYKNRSRERRSKNYLVGRKNSEGVNDLFGSVGVGGFPGHEVKEGIEVHKTSRVRINSSQDALEVNFTLKRTI